MATEEDKTNNGALLTLVAVGLFAMVAITLAVTAIAREEIAAARAAREEPGANAYNALHKSQLDQLTAGTSIDRLKQDVVQTLARDPHSASPPLAASAVVAPSPAPAGSGSAAPAAPGATPAMAPGAAPVIAPGATPSKAPAPAPKAPPAAAPSAAPAHG